MSNKINQVKEEDKDESVISSDNEDSCSEAVTAKLSMKSLHQQFRQERNISSYNDDSCPEAVTAKLSMKSLYQQFRQEREPSL